MLGKAGKARHACWNEHGSASSRTEASTMLGQKEPAIDQTIGDPVMMIRRAEWSWRKPQRRFMILYFLVYSLLMKVYKPLLHPLATLARVVFYGVTVHVVGILLLWHGSLKMSSTMLSVLVRKLRREVLPPVIQIMWQSQVVVQNGCFYLASALQRCATRRALDLLVLLKHTVQPAVSSVVHPSHACQDSFLQANNVTYQTVLRPVVQQIVVSLFLGFLDGVQSAFHLSVLAARYELTQFLTHIGFTHHSTYKENIPEDITCILPLPCVPLSNRFKGPATSILKDMPQTIAVLKLVVATEYIVRGPGKYGLEGTDIPLHRRFQSNTKNSLSMPGIGTTVKQVKKACVVLIAFYLSMFSMIIKTIG